MSRDSLLLAFVSKLIVEQIELGVIQSRDTQGITGTITSPLPTSTCKTRLDKTRLDYILNIKLNGLYQLVKVLKFVVW